MNDAVCEILDVDHRRLVRFLPTDQEDIWPDWRDRNLHGLRGPLDGTPGGGERHHRLRFEVEMVDPTPEIGFIHVADSWKVDSGHGLLLSRRLYRCLGMIPLLSHEASTHDCFPPAHHLKAFREREQGSFVLGDFIPGDAAHQSQVSFG